MQRSWLVLLAALLVPAHDARSETPRGAPAFSRVVVLHGSDSRSPSQVQGDNAFRQAIIAKRGMTVEIYNEDLDLTRFPDARMELLFVDMLRLKHGARPPDVVVAFGSVALDFAERHHDALWPRAPLVFMGIDETRFAAARGGRAATGAVMQIAAARSLELGLLLRPQTKRVAIVAGVSDLDRTFLKATRVQLERFAGRLEMEYLTDLPLAEITRRLRALPRDSLVMPLSMFRDSLGQTYASAVVVASLGAESNAPILALAENYFGRNTLGGRALRFSDQGRDAGELVSEILAGRDPRSLPVRRPDNVCIVDWRELRRWEIPMGRVPADCEVRHREYTLWQQHWLTALVVAAIILLQGFLISVLIYQRRQRLRAEGESQRQHSQLAHAARLATVGELTASIAHEINQPLGAILSNADAAEILLESPNPNLTEVRHILADIRRDDERASAVIQRLRTLLARHELDRRRLEPNLLAREAMALITQEADRRGTRLAESLAFSLPAVMGDRVHLVQVLIILLINAIDAMDAMPVDRRVIVVSTQEAQGMVEFGVTDAGPGIPATDIPRLFDSFFTTKEKGMGLGLSIARSIVETHGGRIWAENAPDGGAVFRFRIAGAP